MRHGFTLIELMVAIVIIGILAAMIIPAVSAAQQAARRAEVLAEMRSIDAGIAKFKNRYGTSPPSGIVLYETGSDWSTTGATAQDELRRITSRSIIRRIWPQFDYTLDRDINQDGDTTDVLYLNGSECLVFFLGGMKDPTGTEETGFAANALNPLVGSTSNGIVPFHEFDNSRFVDEDADGMWEYLDSLPGQTKPFLFLAAGESRRYRPYGVDLTPGTVDDELSGLTRMYYSAPPFITSVDTALNEPIPPDANEWNRHSYQLISSGVDFEYGLGGYYDGNSIQITTAPPPYEFDPRSYERDNITNFKNGPLN